MATHLYKRVKQYLGNYKYSSMQYLEAEDLDGYQIIAESKDSFLLHGRNASHQLSEFHWMANDSAPLLAAIQATTLKGMMTFIPKLWVDAFRLAGFSTYGILNEYWHDDIAKTTSLFINQSAYEVLKPHEAQRASEVTKSCSGQSREFHGESKEWILEWLSDKTTNVDNRDNQIIIKRVESQIAGIIAVTIYGDDSPKGSVLWIRVLAVDPNYQGIGIGNELVRQALTYGVEHHAKRAFLMADELNGAAIHIYHKLGFRPNTNGRQIDMILA